MFHSVNDCFHSSILIIFCCRDFDLEEVTSINDKIAIFLSPEMVGKRADFMGLHPTLGSANTDFMSMQDCIGPPKANGICMIQESAILDPSTGLLLCFVVNLHTKYIIQPHCITFSCGKLHVFKYKLYMDFPFT